MKTEHIYFTKSTVQKGTVQPWNIFLFFLKPLLESLSSCIRSLDVGGNVNFRWQLSSSVLKSDPDS